MAKYPPPGAQKSAVPNPSYQQSRNIEIWAEETTLAVGALSLNPPFRTRLSPEVLTIPLEESEASRQKNDISTRPPRSSRSEPVRRDSLKRREALLKGNEGSRRRQRWENDRLLNNPWAQPPLPSDWEVHPTYRKHAVPYYLAPLWDVHVAAKKAAGEKEKAEAASSQTKRQAEDAADSKAGKVPKELREKLKKAKAAKGLLQALEEEVRKFIKNWEEKNHSTEPATEEDVMSLDSDDEEIIFVGRNGQMHEIPSPPNPDIVKDDKLVFDSAADDHGANFGRWLVHSIGSYYGLRTWSVTVGDPARREAYVGIKHGGRPVSPMQSASACDLPRPLWGMV